MIRYTTPLLPLEVEGIDLTSDNDVYVTLAQGENRKITKSGVEITIAYDAQTDISTIDFTLTQVETAAFELGKSVDMQVNFINSAGVRDATNIVTIPVMRNLLDKEIHYGD
jgi:hypothetical protein